VESCGDVSNSAQTPASLPP
jgi:dodecin